MTGTLTLSFPLEHSLTMERVAIRAHAHLDGAHLGGVIVGQDLDQGMLDLDANVDGLSMTGKGVLAGIPASLKASMDFRTGGPGQVVQRISVSGRPSTRQLATAGLDAGAALDGTIGLDATLSERRDGSGDVAVTADLAPATMTVSALAWRKPAGAAMTAAGRLLLSHDRLTGIADLRVNGDGAACRGQRHLHRRQAFGGTDRPVRARPHRRTRYYPAAIAGTAQGDAAGPIGVSLTGPTLDLSARLTHQPTPRPRGAHARRRPGRTGRWMHASIG